MQISKAQLILSILLIVAFIVPTWIIGITPVFTGDSLTEFTEYLLKFASIYSGIIGIIVGYYFGKGGKDEVDQLKKDVEQLKEEVNKLRKDS